MLIFILIVFTLTCYGLSNMIIYSNGPYDIFIKWRIFTDKLHHKFGELFACMMCLPFWVGALFSLVDIFLLNASVITPFNILLHQETNGIFKYVMVILMDGFLSSGSTWLIHNIEEFFETNGGAE